MVGHRKLPVLSAVVVALALVSASRAADSIDFGFYPKGAQQCMYEAADASHCESSSVPLTNSCLCRNGGDFITNTAACLGRSSRNDLRTVYQTMRDACDDSETHITVTEDEFMNAANAISTSTASPEAASAGEDEEKSSGLSTAAMAGIIVGSVAALAVLGALAFFLFRRRRKLGEESHPMLPQQSGHMSLVPTTPEMSGYFGNPTNAAGWQTKDWGHAPNPADVRKSGFNWESPAHLSYAGAYALAPSPPPPAVAELDSVEHHPTGTAEAPAEMGGTPVTTIASPQTQFPSSGLTQSGVGWHQPPT